MPTLKVNGQEVTVEDGMTVLQACEAAGVEIPRFCYHDRLSVAGNCRMCLVQLGQNTAKPGASCALPAADGMEVFTDTPMVKKAREGIMEFLLINHPLDCPICDQGGECDLQDLTVKYGSGKGRFSENKRAVTEKYMGPLIKTEMTRCIQCTRCVRFATEVAGVNEIGLLNRGENVEITTLEHAVTSELSANVIDLCPVGALTSKPYAFEARSWELSKTESIDVMDAVGSNIRVDHRGNTVLRVMPMMNDDVNEEWISDKTRYACDGLRLQRLDTPYIKKDGKLQKASWDEAFSVIASKLKDLQGSDMAAIAGDQVDVESMYALKKLMASLGSTQVECRQDGSVFDANNRAGYLFNSTIAGIEDADALLIVGANPRKEAAVLNSRIRKRWLKGDFPVALVGEAVDLTYDYDHLGESSSVLEEIASGKHAFVKTLKAAKKPMIIVGPNVMTRSDAKSLQVILSKIASSVGVINEDWNGYNQLHTAASRVGALDIGFVQESGKDLHSLLSNARSGHIKFMYLLGADEFDVSALEKSFVVYQGHHGDKGAACADVILPGCAYTEKDGIYVNLEGRVQHGYKAVFAPGEAKEDWRIIRALSEVLGHKLPFDHLEELRQEIYKDVPHLGRVNYIEAASWKENTTDDSSKLDMLSDTLKSSISCYYMTCPITRVSPTMAECIKEILSKEETKKVSVA